MSIFARLKRWGRHILRDTLTLWYCARHPDTPLLPKLLALLLAAYAFSPIDLIPDFIPVLGWLDEALLLPLGIALCLRLIPPVILSQCRQLAQTRSEQPRSHLAAVFIVALWCAALWLAWQWYSRR